MLRLRVDLSSCSLTTLVNDFDRHLPNALLLRRLSGHVYMSFYVALTCQRCSAIVGKINSLGALAAIKISSRQYGQV